MLPTSSRQWATKQVPCHLRGSAASVGQHTALVLDGPKIAGTLRRRCGCSDVTVSTDQQLCVPSRAVSTVWGFYLQENRDF